MKKALNYIAILIFAVFLVSCDTNEIEITSISCDTSNLNASETLESFKLENVKINVFYSNSNKEVIDVTEEMISKEDLEKLQTYGTHGITVVYSGKESTFHVTIEKDAFIVTFADYDETVIEEKVVKKGEAAIPPENPERAGHVFSSWDKDYSSITSDITITATYVKKEYTVRFMDYDKLLKEEIVKYQESATAPTVSKDGYEFVSWDKDYSSIASDLIVYANFRKLTYNVKFYADTTLLKEQEVEYNFPALAPQIPTKEGYTFVSWDKEFLYVRTDLIINAVFSKNHYKVSFYNQDTLLKEELVEHGQSAVAPDNPTLDGFTFLSWDKDYTNVVEELIVRAVYKNNNQTDLVGIKISPTLANLDPMDDSPYEGVYFIKNGVNPLLTTGGGIASGSSMIYWNRIGIDIDENNEYKIVAILSSGDNVTTEFSESLFKIVIYSSCSDLNAVNAFNEAYVGQRIIFEKFDLEKGTYLEGATIMFVKESIEATEVDISGVSVGSVGTTIQLIGSLNPVDSTSKITWLSSNEEIATIDENGLVSLLKKGEVTITAKTTLASATIDITINEKTETNYKSLDGPIASGYIYTKYDSANELLFDTLDIIYCAFLLVDEDGTFFSGASKNVNTRYINYMTQYILPKSKENGCYALFSIGGGGQSDSFSGICASSTLRKAFINNIINVINEYGFDGVDIDWETPKSSEKENFTLLMKELYAAVKANNPAHLVTAAIAGGRWQPPCYDLPNSHVYIDYINMMTYGMVNNTGYYHNALYKSTTFADAVNKIGKTLTSCSIEESITIYNSYGIPNNKIIIGLSFYGMRQTRTYDQATSTWSAWASSSSCSYDVAKGTIGNGYTEYYDEIAGVPYILKDDNTVMISYDNPRSISQKCSYVITKGLAGVMYWQNGQDTTGDLLSAIKTSFSK